MDATPRKSGHRKKSASKTREKGTHKQSSNSRNKATAAVRSSSSQQRHRSSSVGSTSFKSTESSSLAGNKTKTNNNHIEENDVKSSRSSSSDSSNSESKTNTTATATMASKLSEKDKAEQRRRTQEQDAFVPAQLQMNNSKHKKKKSSKKSSSKNKKSSMLSSKTSSTITATEAEWDELGDEIATALHKSLGITTTNNGDAQVNAAAAAVVDKKKKKYKNKKSEKQQPSTATTAVAANDGEEDEGPPWKCPACTFKNEPLHLVCAVCGTAAATVLQLTQSGGSTSASSSNNGVLQQQQQQFRSSALSSASYSHTQSNGMYTHHYPSSDNLESLSRSYSATAAAASVAVASAAASASGGGGYPTNNNNHNHPHPYPPNNTNTNIDPHNHRRMSGRDDLSYDSEGLSHNNIQDQVDYHQESHHRRSQQQQQPPPHHNHHHRESTNGFDSSINSRPRNNSREFRDHHHHHHRRRTSSSVEDYYTNSSHRENNRRGGGGRGSSEGGLRRSTLVDDGRDGGGGGGGRHRYSQSLQLPGGGGDHRLGGGSGSVNSGRQRSSRSRRRGGEMYDDDSLSDRRSRTSREDYHHHHRGGGSSSKDYRKSTMMDMEYGGGGYGGRDYDRSTSRTMRASRIDSRYRDDYSETSNSLDTRGRITGGQYYDDGSLVSEMSDPSVERTVRTMQTIKKMMIPSGEVTIIYTDVQGSTALWEADPMSMKKATDIHDSIIRRCYSDHGGYEITTEGDAFNLAFQHPADAVAFALKAQLALYRARWPEGTLKHPDGCDNEKKKFRGFRVRFGMHHGPTTSTVHKTTGRTTYQGEGVEIAKAIEKMSHGGQILTTVETWRTVSGMAEQLLGSPQVMDCGEHLLWDPKKSVLAKKKSSSKKVLSKRIVQLVPNSLSYDFFAARGGQEVKEGETPQKVCGRVFPPLLSHGQLSTSFLNAPYIGNKVAMVFVYTDKMEAIGDRERKKNYKILAKYVRSHLMRLSPPGYECQEDKGSWMLAFDRIDNGINFGLDLKENVMKNAKLLGEVDKSQVFRVGIHWGPFLSMGPHTVTGKSYINVLSSSSIIYLS